MIACWGEWDIKRSTSLVGALSTIDFFVILIIYNNGNVRILSDYHSVNAILYIWSFIFAVELHISGGWVAPWQSGPNHLAFVRWCIARAGSNPQWLKLRSHCILNILQACSRDTARIQSACFPNAKICFWPVSSTCKTMLATLVKQCLQQTQIQCRRGAGGCVYGTVLLSLKSLSFSYS